MVHVSSAVSSIYYKTNKNYIITYFITACPLNFFKTGTNSAGYCSSCPAHSHTAGPGSFDIRMCMCDTGYRGKPGGPCSGTLCKCLRLLHES